MFAMLRNRDFGLLWLAGLVSYAGSGALLIALPLHVYRLTDSTLAISVVLAANFLPGILFGSIAGVFVDRWDRKRTMVVADLSRAVMLLPLLVVPDNLALVAAIAGLQGALGLFFSPAESALLPALVGEDQLVAANAMNSLNDNLGVLFGPALGALLYARVGIGGAALADALSYVGSAILIGLIAADSRPRLAQAGAHIGSPLRRMAADWRAGLGVVRDDRALVVVFASRSLADVAEGVFVSLGLTPLVLDVLGGTPAQVGWLASAQAIGGLIAGVIMVRVGGRFSLRWLIGGGLVGVGITDFGAFNAYRVAAQGLPAVSVAMGWMLLAGFPVVGGAAGRQSLVQTHAGDAFRGRVFGALGAIRGAALLIGLVIGGVLGDAVGLVPVLSASVLARVVGGVLALALLPKQEGVAVENGDDDARESAGGVQARSSADALD